ncbi:LysR family transcriptional regulator [Vibrio sp. MACH09]|uniref:LysR family transcriptional regulator n=1 Tax=unclassified Vibrio TaxID=2614977 RepID=UPI0014934397|nr:MULTISPECIES: LysR family transcriptional regulator [unclassified Vibrio]NOI65277.1 LysR family transcriptional regulator [Vibrio sp. 99-8-1]GLO60732.1 LysR family transcriptional regulator [Vibrio sp. MACH09]
MLNIETKWLQDFLTLAEIGNFSKAAQKRNVTQSTFSRRIQALEGAVGCQLFDRDKTPIALTQSGSEFRSSARSLMIQLEYELERLNDLSVLGNQKVSLVAGHSIATDILPQFRFNLFAEEKEVILDVRAIDIDDAVNTLQQSACDIVLSYKIDQLHSQPYLAHKIGESKIYCVSALNEEGTAKYQLSKNQLSPWIMHSTSSYMGRLTREISNQYALRPIFSSAMTDLVKALVLRGEGIGWLPDYAITEELRTKQLVILQQQQASTITELYAYRSRAKLHPAGEQVWQTLCEHHSICQCE